MAQNKAVQAKMEHHLRIKGIFEKPTNMDKARAFEEVCAEALLGDEASTATYCDGKNDCGIDVYYYDQDRKHMTIMQCKYDCKQDPRIIRTEIGKVTDFVSDIRTNYARIENVKKTPDEVFEDLPESLNKFVEDIRELIGQDMKHVLDNISYYLFMASDATRDCDVIEKEVKINSGIGTVRIIAGQDIIRLYDKCATRLEGVPQLDLGITLERLNNARATYAVVNRVNDRYQETFTLPVSGDALAEAIGYEFHVRRDDDRLFANNVRGFLGGGTSVSKNMKATIGIEPERFIDYNNGISIVCSEIKEKGKNAILENAVIINGGQTASTIWEAGQNKADLSKLFVNCTIKVEQNGTYLQHISINKNTQQPVKAVDMRSTDEKAILLQSHLLDEECYVPIKRGRPAPYKIAKDRKWRNLQEYVQNMIAFTFGQPVVAREKGSELLMMDSIYNSIMFDEEAYTHDNDVAKYIASVTVLRNHLKAINESSKKDLNVAETQGAVYPALSILGVQSEMLLRASKARQTSFGTLGYNQPLIVTSSDRMNVLNGFKRYDMFINHASAETIDVALKPFMQWIYEELKTNTDKLGQSSLANAPRSINVCQAIVSDFCTQFSKYNYETCEDGFPWMHLLKPYEKGMKEGER